MKQSKHKKATIQPQWRKAFPENSSAKHEDVLREANLHEKMSKKPNW